MSWLKKIFFMKFGLFPMDKVYRFKNNGKLVESVLIYMDESTMCDYMAYKDLNTNGSIIWTCSLADFKSRTIVEENIKAEENVPLITECSVDTSDDIPPIGSVWEHYKGNQYQVLLNCVEIDSNRQRIVYKQCTNKVTPIWGRYLSVFLNSDTPSGVPRFKRMD